MNNCSSYTSSSNTVAAVMFVVIVVMTAVELVGYIAIKIR